MYKNIALPSIDANHFPCFPEAVGMINEEPQHVCTRRSGEFPHFNLHLVTQGRGYVEIDGKTYELKAGDSFLFSPYQAQHYYSSEEEPWEVYFVHFYGTKIKEFLAEKGFYLTSLWTMKQREGLVRSFGSLIEGAEKNKLWQPAVLSTLTYAIVAEYVTQATPLAPRKDRSSADLVMSLMPELQERACEPFELKEWADRANVSTFYFCKLFRKLTHLSPMEFITLCRIRQAKQMLIENRHMPLANLALSCGYPSVSYFIQRFKKQEGLTPQEYRRNV
ncbi:AraC family transcriptional regulator [Cohnella endophytica]|uniref:AraC family transcriptional regulator n=1 Tax=Cohnella endophytica TaxID=2419778 RepID=A0A494X0I8_9BACL|nr:helix-turn-helix domain-containing protein [Cohnella endophytica]RKP44275.1 AraC family transcriptional regulator [Cohnella endophytica]